MQENGSEVWCTSSNFVLILKSVLCLWHCDFIPTRYRYLAGKGHIMLLLCISCWMTVYHNAKLLHNMNWYWGVLKVIITWLKELSVFSMMTNTDRTVSPVLSAGTVAWEELVLPLPGYLALFAFTCLQWHFFTEPMLEIHPN